MSGPGGCVRHHLLQRCLELTREPLLRAEWQRQRESERQRIRWQQPVATVLWKDTLVTC